MSPDPATGRGPDHAPADLPLARAERAALCDLASERGPTAPTCCGSWTAHDLVAHLLLRERRPLAAAGIMVPALSPLTDRQMRRFRAQELSTLVARLRRPALPFRLVPALDRMANTAEFFVHHEDLRRAVPSWQPRELSADAETALWGAVRTVGAALVRSAGVPVTVRRTDASAAAATLRRGEDPVQVSGLPSELLLFLFGRPSEGLAFEGPPTQVTRLRSADRGL